MMAPQHQPDRTLYDTTPWSDRPRLRWPGDAALAVTVFLYFEYWEMDPPDQSVHDPRFRDANGYYPPDHFTVSLKEYGNRVGVFRILDLLDRHGLKVTVAANAAACEHYPFLVDSFQRRGYEFAAHGTHATRMITSKMSRQQECDYIDETLHIIERETGQRPSGWIGQDYGESDRTPQLLAEQRLSYVVDWPNDEQPYRMTAGRQLISIPNQAEWDDVQLLWHRRVSPTQYPVIIRAAAERLHLDGAASARFLGLHIHPWILGAPHRIRYLESAVEHLAGLPHLWPAMAHAVAQHAAPQLPLPGQTG